MKVVIGHEHLLRALRVLSAAISRANPTRYSALGLTARDDQVVLRAVSTDWDVRYTVPAHVQDAGETWVPSDLFRALPWAYLGPEVAVRASGQRVTIAAAETEYGLTPFHPRDIVHLPQGKQLAVAIPGERLAELLRLGTVALPRVPGDEAEGVWLYTEHGRLSVASFDGIRTAKATITATLHADLAAKLPIGAVATLAAMGRACDGPATLYRHPTSLSPTLTLVAADAVATVSVLADLRRDPRSLRTAPAATTVEADSAVVLAALRKVLAIAGTDPLVEVQLRNQRAHLALAARVRRTGEDASGTTTCPVIRVQGRPLDVSLPAYAFQKALVPVHGAVVTISIGPGRDPLVVEASMGDVRYRTIVARLAPEPDAPVPRREPAKIDAA